MRQEDYDFTHSIFTIGESTSPSAWYFDRIEYASSPRPFEMSHLFNFSTHTQIAQ